MKMFKAVLSNADHPEYGQLSVPFPIPEEQYDEIVEMLSQQEIGDAVSRDCLVDEIKGIFPVLKLLEGEKINIDELDYLAQRLESFDAGEAAQFQGTVVASGYREMGDLINLTFCCQQATVITDFFDLSEVGREHYLNLHGGCAPSADLDKLDADRFARELIENTEGWITPYGVVYDNGMTMEQLYCGQHFPAYLNRDALLCLEMSSKSAPEDTQETTFLALPMAESRIARAMQRAGINSPDGLRLRFLESQLPENVDALLDMERDDLSSLNKMCVTLEKLGAKSLPKLGAVALYAEPQNAVQLQHLAEHLDQFDFIPDVSTPREYGQYLIRESLHYEYDENLDPFYDYEKCALQHMAAENGQFNTWGYVAYGGEMSLDELMQNQPEQQQDFQMGEMA